MKTRVAFIIDFIYGPTAGTENQVLKLLAGLDRQRYELHLISLRKTPWLEAHGGELGVALRCFDIHRVRNPGTILQLGGLIRHLRRIKPQVVLTFFTLSNIVGVLAARLSGCGEIWGTRRDFGVWYNNAFRGDLHFLKFANRFVRGIVTNAQTVRDLLVKVEGVDPESVRVISNGIDVEAFSGIDSMRGETRRMLGIPEGAPVVGIVAGLRPMKHHATFLAAAKLILERRGDCHFVIVGDGPLRQQLESLSRELGVASRVRFVGWQSEVRACLSAFDVGVNCSENEGLSNAIMEYLAAGVPCVVSDAGGNTELVENGVNGMTFPLGATGALAEKILRLLDDADLRRRYADNGLRMVRERFCVANMIGEYDRLFCESQDDSRRGTQLRVRER